LKLVSLDLCTDNAAMIGSAARYLTPVDYPGYLDWDAAATARPPRSKVSPPGRA